MIQFNFHEKTNKLFVVYDKFTDICQHNKYLLEYLGYVFRPVNRSSSGHQYSESEVLFRYWDPSLKLTASQAKSIYTRT